MGNVQLTNITLPDFAKETTNQALESVLTTLDNLIGIRLSAQDNSPSLTDDDKTALTTHLRGVFELKTNAQQGLLNFLNGKQITTQTDSAEQSAFTAALAKASPVALLTELSNALETRVSAENFQTMCSTIKTQCQGNSHGQMTLVGLSDELATGVNTEDAIKFLQENIPKLTKDCKEQLSQFMDNVYIPFKTQNPGQILTQTSTGPILNQWAQGITRNIETFAPRGKEAKSTEQEIARRLAIKESLAAANQELQELQSSGMNIDTNKFIDDKLDKMKESGNVYKEDLAEIHQHLQSVLTNGSKVEERQSGMKGFLDNIGGKNALLFLFLPIIAGPAAMLLSKVPLVGGTLAKVLNGFVEHGSSAMVAVVASGLTKGGKAAPAKTTQGA